MNTLNTASTNVVHTFADTGAYTVKLKVTTNVGCSAENSRVIHVYPYPATGFASTNLCEKTNAIFTATVNTNGYPITQWNWNFADPSSGINNTSALQNTSHTFLTAGTYTVQLIAQNAFKCADTTTNLILIKYSPSTNFSYSLACKDNIINFSDATLFNPAESIQTYYWNFDDLITSGLQNPIHAYPNTSTYNVKHITTLTNGCKDSVTIPITIYPKPLPAFSFSNTCVSSPVVFSDASTIATGTITSRNWNFGDNTISTSQSPLHTYSDTISAYVKLLLTSDHGCKDSIYRTVVIHSSPIADFSPTPPYGTAPLQVTFTNTSIAATSYYWDLVDTLNSTDTSPTYTYSDTGNYEISLTAVNAYGCIDSIKKTIEVLQGFLDVAIQDISTTIENNYLKISVQLKNNGNVDISDLEITVKVNDVTEIKEKWTGLIVKNGVLIYEFPTSILLDNSGHFICISIDKPNGLTDEVPENNNLCKALDGKLFQVLEPYPNPVKETFVLPVILPQNNRTGHPLQASIASFPLPPPPWETKGEMEMPKPGGGNPFLHS